MFLVVEGLDGTGKSTIARALAEEIGAAFRATPPLALAGLREVVDRELCHSPTARQLFYAAGVAAASDEVRTILAGGGSVVMDRYWLSTSVYNQVIRRVPIGLAEVERLLLVPSVTILLEADLETRQRRLAARAAASSEDHRTLDPVTNARLRDAYRDAMSRPIAGRPLIVATDGRSVAEIVEAIRQSLADVSGRLAG